MNPATYRRLQKLAQLHEIEPAYIDVAGNCRQASPETLGALLAALGVGASDEKEIQDSLARSAEADAAQVLEPVSVLWQGRKGVSVRLPEPGPDKGVHCQLMLEDGSTRTWTIKGGDLRKSRGRNGERSGCKWLPLAGVPEGYHRLTLTMPRSAAESMLIAAPSKCYGEPGMRKWGLFLPVYACHSERSWGAGDLTDWMRLSTWAARWGSRVMGSLPLLAGFLEEPFEPSPYSPLSRLFWNEFYIDVTTVPEFAACAAAQRLVDSKEFFGKVRGFRENALVDYRQEMELKAAVLQLLADFFHSRKSARTLEFEAFVRRNPELEHYAQFRATTAQQRSGWRNWPERMRHGSLQEGDYAKTKAQYYAYTQWVAQAQMDQALELCRSQGVQFYLDLPLGVNPAGYDTWRYPELFLSGVTVGAPPDAFFTKGQDWGFAPLDPGKIRHEYYRYVLQTLRFHMRHTGLLRIDHVMGLHRLYCVPKGMRAKDGAYIRYRAEELYALLCLESHRHKTVLVGENLGTVPGAVNRGMERHGIRKMFVFQYELNPSPGKALRAVPQEVVASLNTHDMPTFAAFVNAMDIADRRKLGLIKATEIRREGKRRRELIAGAAAFLRKKRLLRAGRTEPSALMQAALSYLGGSDAEVVLANLEDLWLETEPQNVPGTTTERANWRRKTRFKFEQFSSQPEVLDLLQVLAQRRKRDGGGRMRTAKHKGT